jgi:hypothetical protein
VLTNVTLVVWGSEVAANRGRKGDLNQVGFSTGFSMVEANFCYSCMGVRRFLTMNKVLQHSLVIGSAALAVVLAGGAAKAAKAKLSRVR